MGVGGLQKSLLRESNPWPFAYEANALPTELNRHIVSFVSFYLIYAITFHDFCFAKPIRLFLSSPSVQLLPNISTLISPVS